MNITPYETRIYKKLKRLIIEDGYIFVQIMFLIMYALIIFNDSYWQAVGISNDSAKYLRQAIVIKKGYAFNSNGIAGGNDWFASFPIGYPMLIAITSAIFTDNVYLASRILAVIMVISVIIFFAIKFKDKSCFFSLVFLDVGVLKIYGYAWSETVFIPLAIAYTYILGLIINSSKNKLHRYLLLYVVTVAMFAVRYMGLFAIGTTGLAIVYVIIKNRIDKALILDKKVRYLFIANALSMGTIACYLGLNKIKTGHATGLARSVFSDDLLELKRNFIEAIFTEMTNIFACSSYPAIKYFSYETKVVVDVLCFLLIVCGISLRVFHTKKIDQQSFFVVIGGIYYCVFSVIRFHSSMDRFGYRFFAPGTVLILIGLLWMLVERKSFSRIRVEAYAFMFVVFLLSSVSIISLNVKEWEKNNLAYETLEDEQLKLFSYLPSGAAVIDYTGDRAAIVFRADLAFNTEKITNIDRFNTIVDKYDGFNGIYLYRKEIEEFALNDDGDDALKSVFSEICLRDNSSGFVKIK